MSPSFVIHEAGTSLNWDGDMKVCLFKYCQKRLFFVGYPAILALRAMKRQIQLPSLPWILPRGKVGVPYTDFKHLIIQYVFFTWQDDWNGVVMNKLHSVKPVLGDWQS